MRAAPAVTIFVSLVASVALSLGATITFVHVLGAGEPRSAPATSPIPPSLDARLQTVERELDDLQRQIEMIAAVQMNVPIGTPSDSGVSSSVNALRQRVDSLRAAVDALMHDREGGEMLALNDLGDNREDGASPSATAARAVDWQAEVARIARAEILLKEENDRRETERRRDQQRLERMQQRAEWLTEVYNRASDRLQSELALTPHQTDNVKILLDWRKEQMMLVYDETIPNEQKPDWQAVNTNFDERIRTIINAQQYQIYKEKRLDNFNTYNRDAAAAGSNANNRPAPNRQR